ncbi:MAG: TetR/AcrR family transcriptional regulator [Acidimicrobiia bacterium]|nr:TetR/AcrR family transcriptional regulator [Acidimicrobiia bacterium]
MTLPAEDPRQKRREAKIADIVDAAWSLAQRDGLGAISLRDLAAAVGLRQPSLYVYFGSKLALYDAMFADGYHQLLRYLDDRDYAGDPRDALVDFVRDLLLFSSANAVRHQMLFQRTLPGFEPSPEAYAPSLEFSRRAIALCAEVGITAAADIDLFSALMNGMAHQQVANDPGGHRWADHAERAVDMLLTVARQPTRNTHKPKPKP